MKSRKPQHGRESRAGKPWLEVRKGKIARARKLLADPSYPPPKVLHSVARLLARHLRPGD